MNDMIHSRNILTKFDIFSNLRYNIIMKIDIYLLCHFALEGDITLLLKRGMLTKLILTRFTMANETETKTTSVAMKVTPTEKELLKQKAKEANTTVSRLLYAVIAKEYFNQR